MSVCPHLRKKSEEEYICTRIDTTVNPFLAPCLSNYEECPFYRKEEARERAVQVRKEVPGREEKREVARAESIVGTIEAEARLLERGINEEVRKIEGEVASLNKLWDAYEEAARKIIEAWQTYKRALERRLASLNKEYESYEIILNEMEMRRELGMIDEATYQKSMAEVQAVIDKLKENIEQIENVINHVDELLNIHYKRIKPSIIKVPPSKIKLSLLKLDELYKKGEIDKKLYEKLRKELEEDYEILIHYV